MSDDLVRAAAQFGTPIYVVREAALLDALTEFKTAMSQAWPHLEIVYSYKTNPLLAICERLAREGIGAEVVSERELAQALRTDVGARRVVFDGPLKHDASLVEAIDHGVMINIDNFEELERLVRIAGRVSASPIGVGIRVSFGTIADGWSKFGFDYESGEFERAVDQVRKAGSLSLHGVHCHTRSNILDIDAYEEACHRAAVAFDLAHSLVGNSCCLLDLGSGFPSRHPRIAAREPYGVPTLAQYAQAMRAGLVRAQLPESTTVLLEPGRVLVAECASLVTAVVSVKSRLTGDIAIVDAGTNMVPGIPWYRYEISLLRAYNSAGSVKQFEMQGSLCENVDTFGKLTGPRPNVGDLYAIEHVGAYDLASRSFDFIRHVPPVIWLDTLGGLEQISESLNRPTGNLPSGRISAPCESA